MKHGVFVYSPAHARRSLAAPGLRLPPPPWSHSSLASLRCRPGRKCATSGALSPRPVREHSRCSWKIQRASICSLRLGRFDPRLSPSPPVSRCDRSDPEAPEGTEAPEGKRPAFSISPVKRPRFPPRCLLCRGVSKQRGGARRLFSLPGSVLQSPKGRMNRVANRKASRKHRTHQSFNADVPYSCDSQVTLVLRHFWCWPPCIETWYQSGPMGLNSQTQGRLISCKYPS